jgi:HEAT repeat protein
MFPALLPNADGGSDGPPLQATLASIAAGPVTAVDVARLSDLGREDARSLARMWEPLPEATRLAVVRQMTDLSEERIDLNFGRALRLALDDDSAAVRQLVVAGLWEDEGSDLLGRLMEMASEDVSQDVQAEALRGLSRFADKAVAGELGDTVAREIRDLLIDQAAGRGPLVVRRRALESAGVLAGDDDIGEVIRLAYESGEHDLQASALYAMGRSLDERWLPIVREELASPDAELRYEAARAAGELRDDEAVPELGGLAQDHDAEVRQAAIVALGRIGGRAAISVLQAFVDDAGEVDVELLQDAMEEAVTAADPLRVVL